MYCADPLWAHMTTNEGVLKVRRKRILISERALAMVRALFISVSNNLTEHLCPVYPLLHDRKGLSGKAENM
jgi:hypothetical protein